MIKFEKDLGFSLPSVLRSIFLNVASEVSISWELGEFRSSISPVWSFSLLKKSYIDTNSYIRSNRVSKQKFIEAHFLLSQFDPLEECYFLPLIDFYSAAYILIEICPSKNTSHVLLWDHGDEQYLARNPKEFFSGWSKLGYLNLHSHAKSFVKYFQAICNQKELPKGELRDLLRPLYEE